MCTSEINLFQMRSEASKMKSWMVANIFQLFLFLSVAQTVTCCVSVSACPPQTRTWSSPPFQGKNMTLAPLGLWWLAQFVWRNLAEETWKSSAAGSLPTPLLGPVLDFRFISDGRFRTCWCILCGKIGDDDDDGNGSNQELYLIKKWTQYTLQDVLDTNRFS